MALQGCGIWPRDAAEPDPAAPNLAPPAAPGEHTRRNELVILALSLVGTPYRWGGQTRDDGFDCSGLVTYVYSESLAITLPRTSRAQARAGRAVRGGLEPADLVFFTTERGPSSHVGIYVGESRFVHAPSARSVVRIEGLGGAYWRSRFDGARRVIV